MRPSSSRVERRDAHRKGHSQRGRLRESGGAQTCHHGSRYGSIWASHQALGALTCCGLNPERHTIQSASIQSVNSIQSNSSHPLNSCSSCPYITQASIYCSVSVLAASTRWAPSSTSSSLQQDLVLVASRPMHELLIIIPRLSLAVHKPSPQAC